MLLTATMRRLDTLAKDLNQGAAMPVMHVWPMPPRESEGQLVMSATVESAGREKASLWYRVPLSEGLPLTEAADPYLAALVLTAMERGEEIRVHGEASPSLLRNLEEFQAAWACWVPDRYRRVDIATDVERERPAAVGGSIAAFSGGLDSSFTVFRHATGRAGRVGQRPLAALVVH